MLSSNDLRNGTLFIYQDYPWKVMKYEHNFKGRGRGKVVVRARNLKDNSVRDLSFQNSDSFEEADMLQKKCTFRYRSRDEAVFNAGGQEDLAVPISKAKWELNFLAKGQSARVLFFRGQPMGINLPSSAVLKVKQTDPGAKGNTVNRALKPAVLETGFITKVPLFINPGDRVTVNTENGEYNGRA